MEPPKSLTEIAKQIERQKQRVAAAKDREKKLLARQRAILARQAAPERNAENRRKYIVGAALIAAIRDGQAAGVVTPAGVIESWPDWLNRVVTRPADRRYFEELNQAEQAAGAK